MPVASSVVELRTVYKTQWFQKINTVSNRTKMFKAHLVLHKSPYIRSVF